MIMETTLTWKVDSTEQAPCPDFVPDPYNTGQMPSRHCLVYHFKNVTKEMHKSFPSKEDADKFKESAPAGCYDWKVLSPLT